MSKRLLILTLAALLIAAACGRDKETTAGATDTSAPTSGTTAANAGNPGLDQGAFGDLGVVCSPAPADEENAAGTDPGVTADSLQVSTFSDPGFSGRLGLNQELFDTAEAFTKWCNEHGGIHGRQIDLQERDAKLAEYQQRIIEACDQGDFFIVGGGAVFDDTGQKDRLACGLPAIPGYVVTPAAIEADLSIQPVPIPNNENPSGHFRYLFDTFPETKDAVGVFAGSIDTTKLVAARNKEALDTLGAKVVYDGTYNPVGETSWRPFIEAMRNAGVKGLYFVGDPGVLASFLTEAASVEMKFDWVAADPNNYDPDGPRHGRGGRRRLRADRVLPVPRSHAREGQPGDRAVPSADGAVQARREDRVPRRPGPVRLAALRQGRGRVRCGRHARLRLGEDAGDHRLDRRRTPGDARPADREGERLHGDPRGQGPEVPTRRRLHAQRRHLQL